MKKFLAVAPLLLMLCTSHLSAAESAGPNPGNLAPAGSSSVSLFTGAFTYAYPISIPPGRQGIQPELQLLYNSQANNGWLGMGWDFSLGSIQRSVKNGPPSYDDTKDTFVLQFSGQTQQLVPSATGSDASGAYTEFHEQIESTFLRIRYYAPSKWQVWSKDGKKYVFQGLAENTSNQKFSFWGLSQVSDTLGNYFQVTYSPITAPGQAGASGARAPHSTAGVGGVVGYMPSSISYTGNSIQGDTPKNQITFLYENRPDILTSRISGFEQVLDSRLKSIQVTCNGATVRTYTLNYVSNIVGTSLLSSITMAGSDGSILPATTFSYQDNTSLSTADAGSLHAPIDFVWRINSQASVDKGTELVDVNGDGLPDIVQNISGGAEPQGEIKTALNTGGQWQWTNSWTVPERISDRVASDGSADEGVRFVDLNGDGYVDILKGEFATGDLSNYSKLTAYINNGRDGWILAPNWAPPVAFVDRVASNATSPDAVQIVDVNGDGLPDIVQSYGGGDGGSFSSVWINNGNGWTQDNSWAIPTPILDYGATGRRGDRGVRFVDLNGDGLVDIIQGQDDLGSKTLLAWLNTGHGWTPAPQFNPPTAFVYRTAERYSFDEGVRFADLNGDGLVDMAYYESGGGGTGTGAWLNTGNGWKRNDSFLPPIRLIDRGGWGVATDEGVRLEDINGDGLVDEIQSQVADLGSGYDLHQTLLNQGKAENVMTMVQNGLGGVVNIVYAPYQEFSAHVPFPVTVVQSVTTSDGLGSSVQTKYSYSGGLYDGSSKNNREFLGFKHVSTTDALGNYTLTTFLQNDNAVDGINLFKGKIAEQDNYDSKGNLISRTANTYDYKTLTAQDSFITQTVTTPVYSGSYININGSLSLSDPNYVFFGSALGAPSFAAAINNGPNLSPGNHYCSSSSDIGDGCDDGSIRVEFPVNQGARDMEFSESVNALTYFGSVNYPTYPYTYTDPSSSVQAKITMKGRKRVNASYFPFLTQTDSMIDDRHSAVSYKYDSYGNVIVEDDQGDVSNSGDDRVLKTDYSNNTDAYLVGLPTHTVVTDPYGTTTVAETWLTYDQGFTCTTVPCYGLLTQTEKRLAGGVDPIVTFNYDAYGNVTDEYDALRNQTKGVKGNHVHRNYETTFHQFQISMTQGLGALTLHDSSTVDPATGQLLTHTDANGQMTQYKYDVFGRLSAMINPLDTTALPTNTYQYIINATAPHVIVSNSRIISGSSTTLTTYAFYDGLGRSRETKAPSSTGKQIVSGLATFDARGLVSKAYLPFTVPASSSYLPEDTSKPFSLAQYDGLGRVIQLTNPDNTIVTHTYSGWDETNTDANGHTKDYLKDAFGRVVQVNEHNQGQVYQTMYQYDLSGNLIQITNSLGKNTVLTYDTLNRKTAMSDPQMGNWRYWYDADGNLIQQTDAKNQSIVLTYDAVNRLLTKKYPNATSLTYTYDIGNYAAGRLSSVTDLSGTQSFAYDKLGRITQKTRSISGTVYTTQMTYDDLGRETSVTYPNQNKVSNVYDGSLFSSVRDAQTNKPYATLTYDDTAIGKIKSVAYGNGMTSNYTYLPKNFYLSGLTSTSSTNQQLQHFGYTFDAVGNIKSITDTLGGANQSFAYDDLDRLTTANGLYGNKSYQYDSFGNLTANPDTPSAIGVDATSLVAIKGTVYAAVGRVNKGLYFNGGTTARLTDSTASNAFGVQLWVRPLTSGSTGYTLSKPGLLTIGAPLADGSLNVQVVTSSGTQTLHVPKGGSYNTWRAWTFSLDATGLKAYVNGALAAQTALVGHLTGNTQAITIGDSFKGVFDGLKVQHKVFSAQNANSQYVSAPTLASNQPLAPTPSRVGLLAAKSGLVTSFKFSGWDLTGATFKFRVDWGTGTYQDSAYTTSGAAIVSTHTWASLGVYGVRAQAAKIVNGVEVDSAWSPVYKVQVSTDGTVSVATTLLGAQGQGGADAIPVITPTSVAANTVAPVYDANGNLTSNNGRAIFYDYENRPIKIITPDSAITQFVYDYEGGRVKKTITKGTQVQASTYIGQIYEVTNGQTLQYISAGSLRVAMKSSNGDLLYYLPDHLGSTNIMVDAAQTKVRSTIYAPFGSTYQTSGTKDSDYKFTGQRIDDSTGLYYYGARYYDPILGRFITADSIVQSLYDPQTLNRYSYCRNNPIRMTDPTGNDWLDKFQGNMMKWVARTFDTRNINRFFQRNNITIGVSGSTEYQFGDSGNSATNNGPVGYSQQSESRNQSSIDDLNLSPLPNFTVRYDLANPLASADVNGKVAGYAEAGADYLEKTASTLSWDALYSTPLALLDPGLIAAPAAFGIMANAASMSAGGLRLVDEALTGNEKSLKKAVADFGGVAIGGIVARQLPLDIKNANAYRNAFSGAIGRFVTTFEGNFKNVFTNVVGAVVDKESEIWVDNRSKR